MDRHSSVNNDAETADSLAGTAMRNAAEGALLHTLINTLPDLIWLKDADGVYLACNPRFERFFGAKEENIIGKTDYDFVNKDLADFFREYDRKAMEKNGPSVNEEWVTYADDGHRELLETIKTPMRDGAGKLIGVLGIARDITGRKNAEAALRESEHRYRALVENSPFCIHEIDMAGRLQSMNKAGLDMLGLDEEKKICGVPYLSAVSERDGGRIKALLQDAFNGTASHFEFAAAGDVPLYFKSCFIPIRDADGKVVKLMGLTEDITERKRLEQQLVEREGLFRAIFEQSSDGVELIDIDTLRFAEANPAACRLLGYTHEEYLRLRLIDTQVDYDEESLRESLRQLEASGGATFENRHRCKNGDILDIEVTARMLDIPGMRLLLGVWRDITARKRAEEERRQLSAALVQSGEAVALTDAEARYVYANPAFCELFGYELDELAGKSISLLMPPEEVSGSTFRQTIAAAQDQGVFHGEVRRRAKDGRIIPVLLKVSPFRDEQGRFMGYIASLTDLTEIKRMEDALRESEKHFRDIIEHAPLGTVTVTLDGRFIEVNQAFCDIVGYSKEALKNLSFSAITHPDDINISLESIQKLMAGQIDSYRIAKRYFHRDGHMVWAQVNTSMQRGLSGEPQCLIAQMEDITAQKRAEDALRESEEKLRNLYELSPLGIALTDMSGRYVEFNESFRRICGYTTEELKALDYWALTPRKYEADEARQLKSLADTGRYGPYEKEYVRKDGSLVPLSLNGVLTVGRDGQKYIWSIVEDITESKRAEENLHITASVFDNSQEAILITDANNLITEVNPAFTQITSYSRSEVIGKNPRLLSSGRHDKAFYAEMWQTLKRKKAWRGEIWNRRKSGEIYAELLSISVICDDEGKVRRHVGVFSDISHLKEYEEELSRIAHYDALTGIPNRMLLADRMKQAISQTAREGNMMAVCYLDLDGFKPVNDTLGHDAGDQVLVEIAKRLGNTIRGGDTAARLGGDEFVVLLLGLERGEECVATLERLLAAIGQPIAVKDSEITLGASIGVSIYPLDDEEPDTLLRHADQAMYVAKQAGKNRFHIYDPALDQRARDQHEFLRSIRHGMEHGQLELYYQPKVNLRTKQMVGAEALIRWQHPQRGLLLPVEFLRMTENTDLDIEIGEWVIATALAQIDRWHRAGLDIEVSINISAYHLESSGFAEKLRRQMERYPDLPPDRLQIEVLETVALNDIAIVRKIIEVCHKFGVSFALDDFGTGYSSLSYLNSLPVDALKIDQSFVRDMLEDKGDMAIVQGVIALARAFGRETVAEGIETDEHYQALLEMGCELGQGYGIARPMRADELTNWRAG